MLHDDHDDDGPTEEECVAAELEFLAIFGQIDTKPTMHPHEAHDQFVSMLERTKALQPGVVTKYASAPEPITGSDDDLDDLDEEEDFEFEDDDEDDDEDDLEAEDEPG